MATITPYINFADQGREAIEFYKSIFGGDAEINLVKDSAMAEQMPAEWGDRIMHLDFKAGDLRFMGSDIISDQAGKVAGNTYALTMQCDSAEQLKEYFAKLSDGGSIIMAPTDSSWGGIFAQCSDKYSVMWMLNYDKPAEA